MVKNTLFLLMASGILIGLGGCRSRSGDLEQDRIPDLKADIRAEITDQDRAEKMLAVVEDFETDIAAIKDRIHAAQAEIVKANADYNVPEETIEALYADVVLEVQNLADTWRDYALKLRSLCTEEEWEIIIGDDDSSINYSLKGGLE